MSRSRHFLMVPLRLLLGVVLGMAVVVAAPVSPIAATNTLTVTNSNDSGPNSLRQIIANAQTNDTIVFAANVTTVTLTTNELTLTKNLIIQGGAAGGVVVTRSTAAGTPEFRIFRVASGASATLSGLTIRNGVARGSASGTADSGGPGNGGGISNEGVLTLKNSTVSGNQAIGGAGASSQFDGKHGGSGNGGGLYNLGQLTLNGATVSDNNALGGNGGNGSIYDGGNGGYGNGGGLVNANGAVSLTNSTVENNRASGGTSGTGFRKGLAGGARGGGLSSGGESGAVTITNTTFSANRASYGTGIIQDSAAGGGLAIHSGTLVISSSTIDGNHAAIGGGLYSVIASVTLNNSIVRNNQVDDAGAYVVCGGGLTNIGGNGSGSLTLNSSLVTGNRAVGSAGGYGCGGGIANYGGSLTLLNSTASDNRAIGTPGGQYGGGAAGGGIYSDGMGTVTLTNSTLSGNSALASGEVSSGGAGGGLFSFAASTVTLTNSTVSGNSVSGGNGSAVGVGDVSVGGGGGGLYIGFYSTLTLIASTVVGNQATGVGTTYTGQGLYAHGVSDKVTLVKVRRSIIAGNGNAATACALNDASFAAYQSNGYNVVEGNCPSGGTGDLVYTGPLNDLLDPNLAENGGPTRTHALVAGSPAIDRVPTSPCGATPADQRGVTRPQGAACDSGAFEYDRFFSVALTTAGPGSASAAPGGPYSGAQQVTLTATWDVASTLFAGWRVDGRLVGWDNPLTLPVAARNHAVNATFVPRKTFGDVSGGRPDYLAITELASRGTILGYGNDRYGPDDTVQRAQMAALIARAMPLGPGTPPSLLTPPACLVGGTWDCEDWGNMFKDRGGVPASLWRAAGTLQHYGVAFGYDGAGCAARGVASPCYAPTEQVSYAQTISFITRAMKAKGYWVDQPGQAIPYAGVPGAHLNDLKTFHYYTQGLGGVPVPPANWNTGATRGWFAMALWQALNSYYSENHLP